MGFKPLQDWVLIRKDEPEEKTAGGIIIPGSARSEPSRGVVEAIGPGKHKKERGGKQGRFVPTVLRPGQRVFFADYASRDAELDGKKITLIREEDILGTFEGPPKAAGGKHPQAETKKGEPSAGVRKAAGVEEARVDKTVSKTRPKKTARPEKTARKTAAPKRRTKTAPAKKGTGAKLKAEKTAPAKKTSVKMARKKTKAKVQVKTKKTPRKTAPKKTKARVKGKKTAVKKPAHKKTASTRTAARKKTPRKT